MSRPTWRVYEVRSKSWSAEPKTISACSTDAPSPSRRLSIRDRTTRQPSWASAQRTVAPAADDADAAGRRPGRRAKSWSQANESTSRRPAGPRWCRRRTPAAPARRPRRGRQSRRTTCSSTIEPPRPSPTEMIVRDSSAPFGRAHRPAQDDRPLQADAVGDVEEHALRSRAPASSGPACRSRAARSRPRGACAAAPGRVRAARPSVSRTTPASRASGESTSAVTRSSRSSANAAAPSGSFAPAVAPRRRAPPVRRYGRAPDSWAFRRSTYGV